MAGDVVVHCADRRQMAAAEALVGEATVRGTVVTGRLEPGGVDELRAQGLAVDVVSEAASKPPQPPRAPLARIVGGVRPLRRIAGRLDVLPVGVLLATPDEAPEVDVCVIRLRGPLVPQWHELLITIGVTLLARAAPFEWTAKIPEYAREKVAGLDFVTGLRSFHPLETCDPRLVEEMSRQVTRRYELVVHDPRDVEEVAQALSDLGAAVRPPTPATVRFELPDDRRTLAKIARMPAVAQIVEDRRGEPCNDRVRELVRLPPVPVGGTGSGQLVAVADSGVDAAHPDLQGKVASAASYGPYDPRADANGHGTHVAATIAGSGQASGGDLRGVAPGAALHVQSIDDGEDRYLTDTEVLERVLADAYAAGARIHNDSWAIKAGSGYRPQSRVIDEYVAQHPDFLVVAASGNSASWPGRRSIDAPGTSKNALVVGATRGDRTGVETPERTWADLDAAFKDAPFGAQPLSGDPEALAGFSGRGPSNGFGRVKPDLVAPGMYIVSARASDSGRRPWPVQDPASGYTWGSGTSMAAAVVSGCAAIVREHLTTVRGHEPSAALLKAVLIAGARWLSGPDAVEGGTSAPNFNQGFGCVCMDTTLPDADGPRKLEFHDAWQSADAELHGLGDRLRVRLHGHERAPADDLPGVERRPRHVDPGFDRALRDRARRDDGVGQRRPPAHGRGRGRDRPRQQRRARPHRRSRRGHVRHPGRRRRHGQPGAAVRARRQRRPDERAHADLLAPPTPHPIPSDPPSGGLAHENSPKSRVCAPGCGA